jgi:hypothetical protein
MIFSFAKTPTKTERIENGVYSHELVGIAHG